MKKIVALVAAVSRGGWPDLAGQAFGKVCTSTLLIVGGHDDVVPELDRRAQAAIPRECELTIVPGVTYLFKKPDVLERKAVLAGNGFITRLSRVSATANP